jgi:hypothetical protein
MLSTGSAFASAAVWSLTTSAGRWAIWWVMSTGMAGLIHCAQRLQHPVMLSTGSAFASPVTWLQTTSGRGGQTRGDVNGDGLPI